MQLNSEGGGDADAANESTDGHEIWNSYVVESPRCAGTV